MKRIGIVFVCLLIAAVLCFGACGVRNVVDNLSSGGSTPEDCFDFWSMNGGYRIAAHYRDLMPAKVILPSEHDGQNVVAIKDGGFKELTIEEVIIPSTIKTFGYEAFCNCTRLKKVTLSEGLITLDDRSFYGCESLQSIVIPNTVASLGELTFRDCFSLTSAVLPDSLTVIDYGTFRACSSLTTVTIGSGVEKLEEYVFEDCSSLSYINYRGTKEEWHSIIKMQGWNYNTGNYTIHCTDGDIAK